MKVLIVDDSPTEVHVYKTYLEKAGIDVVIADTAEDGIRAAQEEAPDVILMDVVMPGMNGFQATRQLSKEDGTASIPIVLLTTKGAETDKVWGMRQGATAYLAKPLSLKQVRPMPARLAARSLPRANAVRPTAPLVARPAAGTSYVAVRQERTGAFGWRTGGHR